jgi:hypothetical protein
VSRQLPIFRWQFACGFQWGRWHLSTISLVPDRPEPLVEWLESSLNDIAGRDPLGLNTISTDRVLPQLLPGILQLSERARYAGETCLKHAGSRSKRDPTPLMRRSLRRLQSRSSPTTSSRRRERPFATLRTSEVAGTMATVYGGACTCQPGQGGGRSGQRDDLLEHAQRLTRRIARGEDRALTLHAIAEAYESWAKRGVRMTWLSPRLRPPVCRSCSRSRQHGSAPAIFPACRLHLPGACQVE